jgi:hypothetical protein
MFRSYDHLQVEIYTSEINMTHMNKTVKNYWSRVELDGNPWTWSNTRNSMQTAKFKILPDTYIRQLLLIVVCIVGQIQGIVWSFADFFVV